MKKGLYLAILAAASCVVLSQNCRYQQYIPSSSRQIFSFTSPNFPSSYPPGFQCYWYAYTDPGSTLRLTCNEVNMNGRAGGCTADYLRTYGGENTSYRCRPFVVNSAKEKLLVELRSAGNSRGGSFRCSVQVRDIDCDCGWKFGTRVVGGSETRVNEFTSLAALVDARRRDQLCGATIISARYVLTAAHCLAELEASATGVLVGAHNLSNNGITPDIKLYKSQRFVIHPRFSQRNAKNDIGLVQVAQPIQFTMRVGPVCLPFNSANSPEPGEEVTVIGWGTTSFGGPKSDVPQKAKLRVVPIQGCQNTFPERNVGADTQFCTYEKGKDACQMDSGGPLYRSNLPRDYLTGIVSYGAGCAGDVPAVSTRVAGYVGWITSTTGEKFCIK